jgi:hypothetical protein
LNTYPSIHRVAGTFGLAQNILRTLEADFDLSVVAPEFLPAVVRGLRQLQASIARRQIRRDLFAFVLRHSSSMQIHRAGRSILPRKPQTCIWVIAGLVVAPGPYPCCGEWDGCVGMPALRCLKWQ